MEKFYQTQEFIDLDYEWKKKLITSGFDDLENSSGQLRKNNASYACLKADVILREAKIEYFRLLTLKTHEFEFKKDRDLSIMMMRSNGVLIKLIAKELGIHRNTVWYIIRRYEHFWGIRYWSLEDRNLLNEWV